MATKSDYYDILGISKSASADEIKKAYRAQALKWHPDRHQGDKKEEAERKFKEINEAYQVLSDSQKRSAYDQFGHNAFTPGGGFSPGGTQTGRYGPFTYTYTSSGGANSFGGFDFGDPFDIFEQFFGGGSPFSGRRAPQIPRYGITLDFMEAVRGAEKKVDVGGKVRKIKIPAGVDEGTRINYNDFILSVNVKGDSVFERDGADVYVKVAIPFSLAALGGMVEVPTVEEKVKIKIRPGTQSGSMLRLRGKGIKKLHSSGYGDEYVRLSVFVPEKLTREQKNLIEEMKNSGL